MLLDGRCGRTGCPSGIIENSPSGMRVHPRACPPLSHCRQTLHFIPAPHTSSPVKNTRISPISQMNQPFWCMPKINDETVVLHLPRFLFGLPRVTAAVLKWCRPKSQAEEPDQTRLGRSGCRNRNPRFCIAIISSCCHFLP